MRDNVHAQNRYAETVAGLLANINGILQTEEQMRQRYLTALDKLMEDTPLAAEAGDHRGDRRSSCVLRAALAYAFRGGLLVSSHLRLKSWESRTVGGLIHVT